MAKQSDNLSLIFTRLGVDYKALETKIGNLTALTTTEKTNLVAAINELHSAINAINNQVANASAINDTTTSTTTSWSSSKTSTELQKVADDAVLKIQQLKDDLLGGASSAFDTFKELQDMFNNDASYASKVADALAKRVRVDAAQTFTVDEQKQACANIGIGDPTVDYVAIYNAAKA